MYYGTDQGAALRHQRLDPEEIETVNVVVNPGLFERLVQSMQVDRWDGREILVEEVIPKVGPQKSRDPQLSLATFGGASLLAQRDHGDTFVGRQR